MLARENLLGVCWLEMLVRRMAVDWRAQIAPRVDRGLASVQYAEVLAGAVVSAMSGVNASAARVQPPILA